MRKLMVVVFAAVFLSSQSLADSPGWVTNAAIWYVTVQPNGRVYVRLKVAVPDLGCTGNIFGYLEFDTNAPHYKEQYSLILAAHMAGRTVDVYVSDCGYYPYAQNTRLAGS